MARHDREERQHRRWLEDARKHLTRGDVEGTVSALLRLPPGLREELLPRSAELFREAVEEQHRRGAWGALSTLAAHADAEPGFVERSAEAEAARRAYWPLMWAAARARDWARARRLWRPLADVLRGRSPHVAEAAEAWLSSQGAPAPERMTAGLDALPTVDARLGVEPARPRVSVPPPRTPPEVEEAVLALRATEPFSVFASRLETWAREASAEVARAVWGLAGQLAARELWLRAEEGRGVASLQEPASLLARSVREGGAPPELAATTLQALRAVAAGLPPEGILRTEEAEAYAVLAQAAALYPDLRNPVVQAVSQVRFSGPALSRALRLYEALLDVRLDVALWARAFLVWDEARPQTQHAPSWLQDGLRRLLSEDVPGLLSWLRGATPSEREVLIEVVALTCSPPLVEAWVEACWDGADEALRHALSGAIVTLLERSRAKRAGKDVDSLLRGAQTAEEAMRVLLGMEGAFEEAQALLELPPEGLRTWRRFASRVLPYRREFLEEASRQATSDDEAWEATLRYLEAHPGDGAYLDALSAMCMTGRELFGKRVLARWLERLGGDAHALAEAAVATERTATPCEYLHPLLEAFLAAQAGPRPASESSAAVRQARLLARAHGIRQRKPRAPRKKKAASEAPSERAPRPKRKSAPRKRASPQVPPAPPLNAEKADDEKGEPR